MCQAMKFHQRRLGMPDADDTAWYTGAMSVRARISFHATLIEHCRQSLPVLALTSLLALSPPARGGPPEADDPYLLHFERQPSVLQMTDLGRQIFFSKSISASRRVACATCHDPASAFAPSNAHAVQLAGISGHEPGVRAVPSLRYRQNIPVFTEHFHEGEDVNGDQGPTGGYTWDGRTASVHDQARLPLFSSYEMANKNPASLAQAIRTSSFAGTLRQAFGEHVLDDQQHAVAAVVLALEVFQQDAKTFYPFSSKYDAYLRRQTALSAAEQRGLLLFEDPARGNCALCHPTGVVEGAFPTFTDNGYIALGVPRNKEIPANRNPAYFDLGLCGPYRDDLADHPEYCGMFRAPSLRNVATRQSFFHNGVIHDLRAAVAFYAERDTKPEHWYPNNQKFNDLPEKYRGNINSEAPFGKKPGEESTLSENDIDDIVAFLRTLTDADQVPSLRSEQHGLHLK
jgi:cytochrome c peroxidase